MQSYGGVIRLRLVLVADRRWWAESLGGAGEWLHEKHGSKTRRSWRKLPIGLDAGSGQIVAASLTAKEVDDGAEVDPLLDHA